MIMVRLIVQLHHGHELEALLPWPGEALPSPRDVVTRMAQDGDLQGWRIGQGGFTPARLVWDPMEASSTVTELSMVEVPEEAMSMSAGVTCQECGAQAVLGLGCGQCGADVTGPPPRGPMPWDEPPR